MTRHRSQTGKSRTRGWRSARRRTEMAGRLPILDEGMLLTHFLTVKDVERSARFYSDVLGGEIVLAGESTCIALANAWVRVNVGGRPVEVKPAVAGTPSSYPWLRRISLDLK